MNNYNGQYTQCVEIIIEAGSHEFCNDIAKKIRYLCKAWPNVYFTEHKSARKGDVLKRDLLIYQTDYSHSIIIFKESLHCITFHYNLFSKANVKLLNRSTIPKQ
jgi:hypothetical protein